MSTFTLASAFSPASLWLAHFADHQSLNPPSMMTSGESIPWGSLPLEGYVLSQWTSVAIDALDERQRHLAQQFAAIGHSGRFVSACYRNAIP